MNKVRPGDLVANRFELEACAGTGGMGTVYRARDRYDGSLVALKLLHNTDGTSGERFSREAQLLQELRHPGIVSYVAHGATIDGQYYLAMEWLEGEELAERLKRGPLSLPESIDLLRRVATALTVPHSRGVVHRDLKPSNLFLAGGQIERVKVLDFGIARQTGGLSTITQTGSTMGTPQYMAPEQARGERHLNPATDIFALGCILYECLAGQPPFLGEHGMAVLVRILLEEPAPISTRLPGISVGVTALLERMLAKSPAQRPVDAAALLSDLEALGGLPAVRASVPSGTLAPKSITDGEQQLLCVVIASPLPEKETEAIEDSDAEELTRDAILMTREQQRENRSALEQELARLGAQTEWLMDGTLVAVVGAHSSVIGSAADQVALAARCGLLVKRLWPHSEVAIGTGRGLVQQQLPAGEAVDRAAKLLRTRTGKESGSYRMVRGTSSGVWLDGISEGLLGGRFAVTQVGGAAVLQEDLAGPQEVDQTRRLMGKPTPCVGREAELNNLEGQLANCLDESEARAVVILAPPGMGKSRLRHEFLRRIEQRGTEVTLLQGRGDMIGAGAPYGILGQAVRRLCGLCGGEPEAVQQQALASRIGGVAAAEQRTRLTAFLGELCGICFSDDGSGRLLSAREDPRLMRDQIRRAFLDWLSLESERAPVLMILDDLHWGDGLSVGLVDEALRELRSQPFMVVALARPELKKTFPRLWQGHSVQENLLKGLSKKASERLVQQVLGKSVPLKTVERIVEQAGGNALFLEELIRAVGEGKADGRPETVMAMLQARIGRLDAGPRRVVRAASVYGQTFWLGGVATLLGLPSDAPELGQWVFELVNLEMIEPHAESRLAKEREYGFRHALLRDAAYSLLVARDAETGHRLASQYLEEAGETDGMVMGEHAERGGDRSRALIFFTQAAEQAFARLDLEGALARTERALRCGPEGEALGILYSLKSAALIWSNEFAQGVELGQQALPLLPKGVTWWCRAVQNLCIIASGLSDPGPMYQLADGFADRSIGQLSPLPYAQAVATMTMELGIMGDRARARPFLALAEEACSRLSEEQVVARAYLDTCCTWQVICSEPDPYRAYLCGQRSGRQNRLTEDWRSLMISELALALAEGELGDNQRGVERGRQMVEIGERLREPFIAFASKIYLLYLLSADPGVNAKSEAPGLIEEILQAPLLIGQGLALTARARFLLHQGDAARAETESRLAISKFPIMLPYRLSAMVVLIDALREQGQREAACTAAEEGLALLASLGGTGFPEVPLRLAAAQAFAAASQEERAHAELRETLRQVDLRADNIPDPKWKESYLGRNPACVRTRELARDWLPG